ncbi:MAG: Fe-S cluster assembly protein SufD [Kiloniellales bacterium]
MSEQPITAAFTEHFGRARGRLPGSGQLWIEALREAAMARFAESGLPSPKAEAWKYTNLRPLEKVGLVPATPCYQPCGIDRVPWLLKEPQAPHRLVFVDGRLAPAHSALSALPKAVRLRSFAAAVSETPELIEAHLGRIVSGEVQPLLALNTALMEDGYVLEVERGVALEQPIELVFLGGAVEQSLSYHPRHLIVMHEGSQATVIEQHIGLGAGPYLANSATEVAVGAGAILRHVKLQAEGAAAFHLGTLHARVERDGVYDAFGLSIGGRLSRNESTVRLVGPGASCRVNGAYLMRDRQHCDNTTVIEHMAPHTTCREVFKGVLDDQARAVFQGRIVVHRDAQQTDGHQLSKALLLSDGAEIDAKPELEIYADDVKCSHGATAGELDHDALFYLQTRGIPEPAARRLLVQAFLAEALEEIAAEQIRVALLAKIDGWLSVSHAMQEAA